MMVVALRAAVGCVVVIVVYFVKFGVVRRSVEQIVFGRANKRSGCGGFVVRSLVFIIKRDRCK